MVRRPLPLRIIGLVLKLVVVALVGVTVGVLLWRMLFSQNVPKSVKDISLNDAILDAYEEKGEDLTIFWQKQQTITTADRNNGYFAVTRAWFYPEADQVQFIFRYNHSTLEHLAADYELNGTPDKGGDWFDLSLVMTDKDGNQTRIHADAEPVREETSLYTYFRVTVSGVTVTDHTEGVFIDIYYKDDVNYLKDAYGTLCIYNAEAENVYVGLAASDRKLLKKALEERSEH